MTAPVVSDILPGGSEREADVAGKGGIWPLLAQVVLAVVGVALYLPHILRGGLYVDDWSTLFSYRFARAPQFTNAVSAVHRGDTRPLLAYFKVGEAALFGQHGGYYLTVALALGICVCLLLFTLLEQLGIPWWPSAAAALLVLLYPWSDSVHLWGTASVNQIAVILYLAGLLAAIRGLSRAGTEAIGWHAAALLLFTLSMLTYEAAAALIPLSGLIYLAARRRRSVHRVAIVDFVFGVSLAAVTYLIHTHGRSRPSLVNALRDLGETLRQLAALFARAVDPFTGRAGIVVGVLVISCVLRLTQLTLRSALPVGVRPTALTLLAAGVLSILAVLPFVGSGGHPLDPGINNRGNILVGLPLVVGVVALVWLLASLWIRQPAARLSFAGVALVAIAVSYAVQVHDDESRWDQSTAIQRHVFATARRLLPRPAPGAVLFTVGYSAMTAPGVPVFSQVWVLRPALSLQYRRVLGGLPLYGAARLHCIDRGVYPSSAPGPYSALRGGEGARLLVPYRNAYLLDVASQKADRLASRSRCERIARELTPRPFLLPG